MNAWLYGTPISHMKEQPRRNQEFNANNIRRDWAGGLTQSIVLVLLLSLIGGCASRSTVPVEDVNQSTGDSPVIETTGARMAKVALGMVGAPYRRGGTNPKGFDCSGLVFYSYDQLGMRVPRTSTGQYRIARPVDIAHIQKGDLVFFDTLWKSGHVGIYIGDGRFVHVPSSGKRVRVSSLATGYFASRMQSAGRLHHQTTGRS